MIETHTLIHLTAATIVVLNLFAIVRVLEFKRLVRTTHPHKVYTPAYVKAHNNKRHVND